MLLFYIFLCFYFSTFCEGFLENLRVKREIKLLENTVEVGVDWEVKSTLETSGEDEKLHSKRVEKMKNYTRNEWKYEKLHSK
jgi:hypothetical protein